MSGILELAEEFKTLTTGEEVIAYLQNAADNGLVTIDEANAFLSGQLNFEKNFEFLVDLAGGMDEASVTVEFTVIKGGDDVLIDEIDSVDDFVAVIMFNMLGTL